MTTTRRIWKLSKFAIRWALQTKCVGGWGGGGVGGESNTLNKALLGGLPLAYWYLYVALYKHIDTAIYAYLILYFIRPFNTKCTKPRRYRYNSIQTNALQKRMSIAFVMEL